MTIKKMLVALGRLGQSMLLYLVLFLIYVAIGMAIGSCTGSNSSTSGGYSPEYEYNQGDYLLEKARP